MTASPIHPPSSSLHNRALLLLINGLVFAVGYTLCNRYAASLPHVANVAIPLDDLIPFWPWMVLAYFCSGPLLALGFLQNQTNEQLRALSQRTLTATVLACLVFCAWPLRLMIEREPVTGGIALFFHSLNVVDRPFNQLPSLHVMYCVVLWPSLRAGRSRLTGIVILLALILVVSSTVLVRQHHLLDLVAGLALGLVLVRFLPVSSTHKNRSIALHYGLLAGMAGIVGWCGDLAWIGAYLGLSCACVAWAYWQSNAHFLAKAAGRFPWRTWLLYAPYLVGYKLAWKAVCWWHRDQPVIRHVQPKLLSSRRLSLSEANALPANCAIIDLANELSELTLLRGPHYQHFAWLDLLPATPEQLASIRAAIQRHIQAHRSVLVHCAMGYSRSAAVIEDYLTDASRPRAKPELTP